MTEKQRSSACNDDCADVLFVAEAGDEALVKKLSFSALGVGEPVIAALRNPCIYDEDSVGKLVQTLDQNRWREVCVLIKRDFYAQTLLCVSEAMRRVSSQGRLSALAVPPVVFVQESGNEVVEVGAGADAPFRYCRFFEAFDWCTQMQEIGRLAERDTAFVAQRGGNPTCRKVSVIVRSMDRKMLDDALWSVALQMHANLEVLVVDAKGSGHRSLPESILGVPIRVIGTGEPLARATAANVALLAASGDYLLFLDDDDYLFPGHISRLVGSLTDGPESIRAAYSGVQVQGGDGGVLGVFDEDWSRHRLLGANFLPIHGVLFHRSLVEAGARMDESLTCLEDWDFWLQVSTFTEFVHVPGVSAVYRYGLGQSALTSSNSESEHLVNRQRIFDKWKGQVSGLDWVQSFHWFEKAFLYHRGLARQSASELDLAQTREAQLRLEAEELRRAREEGLKKVANLRTEVVEAVGERVRLARECADLKMTLEAVHSSTSWRVTAPLRLAKELLSGRRTLYSGIVHRIGKSIYRRLPVRLRDRVVHLAYRRAGWLFKGLAHYEFWRHATGRDPGALRPGALVDLSRIAEHQGSPGTIAVHVHLYYPDLVDEFAEHLQAIPYPFDLYVSVPDQDTLKMCEGVLSRVRRVEALCVEIVPNRGRDIAPFVCTFAQRLRRYDYVAHFHSKKSHYNQGATDGWREYLLSSLLGSEGRVRKIFSVLDERAMVFPQSYSRVPYFASTWLANRAQGAGLTRRLGLASCPTGYFDFPVGSMFWARTESIAPLLETGLRFDDFPVESGQTDGTLAHAIERVIGVLGEASPRGGVGILEDEQSRSWSKWRFEQYFWRGLDPFSELLSDSTIRLVVFDVFDTLLVRPLIDAEDVKKIVAQRAGIYGDRYLENRALAEALAREAAGKDVGIDEIHGQLAKLNGWPNDVRDRLCALEILVETGSVVVRPEGERLLRRALDAGKRVVLASDMYLATGAVADMLNRCGIAGWSRLYVSSEVGLRKDSGGLYSHVFDIEEVVPGQVLVVGDNERSDLQIPMELGCATYHLLRPVELAKAMPRLGPMVSASLSASNLDSSVVLGVLATRFFSETMSARPDQSSMYGDGSAEAIGYGVLGPVVLSFCQWLLGRAKQDGVEHLYFLAREGQFMKELFELVTGDAGAVKTSYLVVSRRAASLPSLGERKAINEIASSVYGPGSLRSFLLERFGIELDQEAEHLLGMTREIIDAKMIEIRGGNLDALQEILDRLEPLILRIATDERDPFVAYLGGQGVLEQGRKAVVDIGYSGTIQKCLNRIPGVRMDGYYMMTDAKSDAVARESDVLAQGFFCERVGCDTSVLPRIYTRSFVLEQMLSSDDAQVIRYRYDDKGVPVPVCRILSEQEKSSSANRERLRSGAVRFAKEYLDTCSRLGVDVQIPRDLARNLFEQFIEQISEEELRVIQGLCLDDYYCGRGIVS